MYAQEDAGAAEAGGAAGETAGTSAADEDVVDAEFEEVDENKS